MTDDEMQALREVEGCGRCDRVTDPQEAFYVHNLAAHRIQTCNACAKLYNDAVVRQRVERMSTSKCVALGFTLFEGRDDTDKYKAALLAALTGENA